MSNPVVELRKRTRRLSEPNHHHGATEQETVGRRRCYCKTTYITQYIHRNICFHHDRHAVEVPGSKSLFCVSNRPPTEFVRLFACRPVQIMRLTVDAASNPRAATDKFIVLSYMERKRSFLYCTIPRNRAKCSAKRRRPERCGSNKHDGERRDGCVVEVAGMMMWAYSYLSLTLSEFYFVSQAKFRNFVLSSLHCKL